VAGVAYAGVNPTGDPTSIGINLFIPIGDALDRLRVVVDRTRGRVVAD
jgi:hypothetical protein